MKATCRPMRPLRRPTSRASSCVRTPGEADIPEMVRIQNAQWEADGQSYRETVEDRIAHYAHPSDKFRPERDVTIAELDGRVVAHANRDWVDTSDGLREYRSGCAVDPAYRRRGVGTTLLRANHVHQRELAASHATDRPRVHGLWCDERNVGANALAQRSGYAQVRWFFDMERPGLDRDLPEITALPDGIEVRPVAESELLTIWRADVEAFRDHWGGGDESEDAFARYRDSPEFDPSMWVVAWEGDEVASTVVNTIYPHENAAIGRKRGWLDSVFTRRAWRKRGLASALIARSLHVLAERGMETAALGVDADNPSGALQLYEKFGFTVTERATAWRKPMEERS